ncbi:MAG TPA: hypothetical protein VF788_02295 [Pseudonocardiaceae bacterium]
MFDRQPCHALDHITDADLTGAPAVGIHHNDVVVPAGGDAAADELQRGQYAGAGSENPGFVAQPGGLSPGVQGVPVGRSSVQCGLPSASTSITPLIAGRSLSTVRTSSPLAESGKLTAGCMKSVIRGPDKLWVGAAGARNSVIPAIGR